MTSDNLQVTTRVGADFSSQSVVLYGPGKVGKTETVIRLAQHPELRGRVVFGDAEGGLGAAEGTIIEIATVRDLMQFVQRLETRLGKGQALPRLVVLDGLDRLYRRVVQHATEEHNLSADEIGSANHIAVTLLLGPLERLHRLPTVKLITAHSREFVVERRSGKRGAPTVVQVSFDMPERIRSAMEQMWDVMLYANINPKTARTEVVGQQQVAPGTPERRLFAADRFAVATDGRFNTRRPLTADLLFTQLRLAAPVAQEGPVEGEQAA